jgi:thiosulfate/3-mercaptopyruvate sulfurtransferase
VVLPVVDASWLSEHPEVVLVDSRSYTDGRSGREAYDRGHLPGAVFVELDAVLAAPPSPALGRHPLPDPEVFAQGMREAGIGDRDTVVVYDDDFGAIASRLVWMLRVTGHQAALLDGGLLGWHGPLEHEAHPRPAATFTARPWPTERLAGIDDLDGAVLLDARPGPRFRGESEPLDARPGHIPGAVSLPCRDNVDSRGALLPVPELRSRLTAAGIGRQGDWVSSCGSGVTACHSLLLAEYLGLAPGWLYVGSWSQWSHTDRPAVTGP